MLAKYYERILCHYGIKGMKWGVRRTPEQLGRRKKTHQKMHSTGVIIKTITGHSATNKKDVPNAITDRISHDGKVDVRTFYDETGWKKKDIHITNHGNPKTHPFGEHGEHVVEFEWYEDGKIKNKYRRDLSEQERKENNDII